MPCDVGLRGERGAPGWGCHVSDRGGIKDLVDHEVSPGNVRSPAREVEPVPADVSPAQRLRLSVAWGDFTRAPAHIHVVGHYQDVLPTAAEHALDSAISGASERHIIAEHTRRGWLVGRLGEVTYFPSNHDTVHIAAVAGLGRPGTFTERRAVRLYTSLLTELLSLAQVQRAAVVLIGSGAGNLAIDQVCSALVDGFDDALDRLDHESVLKDVVIVEIDRLRAEGCFHALRHVLGTRESTRLVLAEPTQVVTGGTVSETAAAVYSAVALARLAGTDDAGVPANGEQLARMQALTAALNELDDVIRDPVLTMLKMLASSGAVDIDRLTFAQAGPAEPGDQQRRRSEKPVRISVLSGPDSLRWSALSDYALVPEREVSRTRLFDELVARLNNPSERDANRLPEWLSRMVIPADFQSAISDQAPLVLELDRSTAPLHWEFIAELGRRDENALPLVIRTPIARQLRTGYSKVLIEPAMITQLRALVIGDPGEGDASLPGAREEAKRVTETLRDLGVQVEAYIGPPSGPREGDLADFPPATRLEVLGELLSGRYQLVHYCGHGTFDAVDPQRAGWVFADGLLTARELAQLTEPPRVVVANACYTSVLARTEGGDQDKPAPATASGMPKSEAKLTPGLADEFLRAGVVHYIGAAWQISDAAGVDFAVKIYDQLLRREASLGRAICAARHSVWQKREKWGLAWAAYQHYGDPTDSLHADKSSAVQPGGDRS